MAFRTLTAAPGTGASQQLIKGDRSMLALSDENSMMKQIQATHAPDGREFDASRLLNIVEDILSRATLQVESTLKATQAHAELKDKNRQVDFIAMHEELPFVIDRISCVVNFLEGFKWIRCPCHNSVVIQHAVKLLQGCKASADNGSFCFKLWRILAPCPDLLLDPLAKSMVILRQLNVILEQTGQLKPWFDALNNLIRVMMEVTKCIVEFNELPSIYISKEQPALSTAIAHIPTAVYWTIRSVVACANQTTSLTTFGHEYIHMLSFSFPYEYANALLMDHFNFSLS
ncbi:hypothetical protein GH714_041882 [Hevea brasiliensis]|uniref:Sieve element occlusion N-terminal domain-containing protein n=1 Tax=Hevea brasiliensis TaxID=3981 RepID=A0A6A6MRV3_HEVBR|nr:hypothetical protein GH714_041882 [Hevea brasiliensis]